MSEAASSTRARAATERICESERDSRTLRLQVLDELRRALGFEAHAWLLTDPVTEVGTAPVADVPWLAELPDQIRMKYLTPVNRWTTLGDAAVALLHETTGGNLNQSLVWRELLARYAVSDVASMVFADRFGCWAFLELWHTGGRRFTGADRALLADLAEPLTLALRRSQAHAFVCSTSRDLPRVGPVALVLSSELQVRGQTPDALDYLRALIPPAPGRDPIPAVAYNVAAQLLAVEADVDVHPASARVHVAGGRWMTARAARLGGADASLRQDIAVTLEECSAAERVDLFARAFGLTSRERELLDQLAEGRDTRAVAERMFVSANTVQDHLKSIFAKTSTHSRRALLSRALGS